MCHHLLGLRHVKSFLQQGETFVIAKNRFEFKPYALNLCIYSLSDKLINEFLPEVDAACKRLGLPFNTTRQSLKKAELANFSKGPDNIDAAILVHRNEGRLLLTDENGLYHNLIQKEFSRLSNKCLMTRGKSVTRNLR